MDKIDEQLNNLSQVEIPVSMHHSIMRKVNNRKLQPVLLFTFALLALNFIVVVWHINARLINLEFTDMVQDFFEVFSFNFSFIRTVFVSFFEIISPLVVVSAILSLIGAIYTGKKIKSYHFA